MSITKTIAVHGATGLQGAPVAAQLARSGHAVRPLSRSTRADLTDRASLVAAYAGADAVVLQLPLVYDERALTMAENAARAAEVAGVDHLVINAGCVLPPVRIGVPFLDARHIAAGADVPRVTVLQPAFYMDNFSAPWSAPRIVGDGVIAYPLPLEAPLPWVAMADVAAAIDTAISHEVGGWFALPGIPTTGLQIAHALDDATGRPVHWSTITPAAFADMLRPHLGDHAAEGTAAAYAMLADAPPSQAPDPTPARDALGWAPRDITTWAHQQPWALARAA
jgi:uncharacterized protein YbjT (DUF2867 family)